MQPSGCVAAVDKVTRVSAKKRAIDAKRSGVKGPLAGFRSSAPEQVWAAAQNSRENVVSEQPAIETGFAYEVRI